MSLNRRPAEDWIYRNQEAFAAVVDHKGLTSHSRCFYRKRAGVVEPWSEEAESRVLVRRDYRTLEHRNPRGQQIRPSVG